jgi:hypothetical protein
MITIDLLKRLKVGSFEQIIGKIVIGSAAPVAIAMFTFLSDIKSAVDKSIAIQQEYKIYQEANNKEQAESIHKLTLELLSKKNVDDRQDEDIKVLKAQLQAAVTQTQLLETMKRVELRIDAEEKKGRSMSEVLRKPIQNEIKFLEEKNKIIK